MTKGKAFTLVNLNENLTFSSNAKWNMEYGAQSHQGKCFILQEHQMQPLIAPLLELIL